MLALEPERLGEGTWGEDVHLQQGYYAVAPWRPSAVGSQWRAGTSLLI